MTRFPTPGPPGIVGRAVPGNHESAGKRKSGRARKGNPALRTALCEAAWAAAAKTATSPLSTGDSCAASAPKRVQGHVRRRPHPHRDHLARPGQRRHHLQRSRGAKPCFVCALSRVTSPDAEVATRQPTRLRCLRLTDNPGCRPGIERRLDRAHVAIDHRAVQGESDPSTSGDTWVNGHNITTRPNHAATPGCGRSERHLDRLEACALLQAVGRLWSVRRGVVDDCH